MPFNQCMLFPVKLTLRTTDEEIRMFTDAARGEVSCMDKKAELKPERGKVYFDIIVDRNTIEIFCNHGQVYMPIARDLTRNYGLEFICRNGKVTSENLQIFELNSIWK